jgi:creatinine amidohydrolase
MVIDVVDSLSRHGFQRIVLLPTHGGNFMPLAGAFSRLEPVADVKVLAFTDLQRFVETAIESSRSAGVTPEQSGAHSGEWETSLMLALKPELVKMDQAAPGFVGELSEIMAKVFDGIQNLDENGVLGDPRPAAAEAGKKYVEDVIDFVHQWVQEQK